MELTLNLVWVCVAVAGILALAVVLSRAAASSEARASTLQKIVAMGCALVILFFVISMTDDLHNQAILFEEKKPSRVLFEAANPAPSSGAQAIPFVFLLFVSRENLVVTLPAARRPMDARRVLVDPSILRKPTDGRAPPASFA